MKQLFDDDALDNISPMYDEKYPHGYVVSGYFGAWNGHRHGGCIVDTLKDAILCILPTSDNYYEIYQEDNNFVVYNHHHDGTSRITIRALTPYGEKYYNNNKDKKPRQDMIDHLFKKYSKGVKYDF